MTSGNFTGHGYPDVAYLAGTQVVLCAAPAIQNFARGIAPSLAATGIATIVGGAAAGGRDGLAIATTSGLYQWTLAGLTLLDARSWASVASGDVNNDQIPDVVGVDGTGTQVLVLLRAAGGGAGTQASIQFPGQIVRRVATVQWNSGAREIAVATDQRIWVGGYTGQAPLVNLARSTAETLGLAALRFNATEGLAWLARSSNGLCSLLTLRPGQTTEVLSVDSLAPVAMTAGDWQMDGYDDVAITTASHTRVTVLTNGRVNSQATTTFSLAAQVVVDNQGVNVTGVTASAWIGDLDGDGLCDMVVPRHDLGGAGVLRQTVPLAQAVTPQYYSLSGTDNGAGKVDFVFTATALQPPPGATHVELIVFRTQPLPSATPDDAGLGSIRLDPMAIYRKNLTLLSPPQASFQFNWSQTLTEARNNFQYAILRFRGPSKFWAPQILGLSYSIINNHPPSELWMPYWAYSAQTPTWTPVVPPVGQGNPAGGAGVIKPPPPPPPPPADDPPAPPDGDTTGG